MILFPPPLSTADVTAAGGVIGPASAADNAIARFDATTGKLIQNSPVIVNDNGNTTPAVNDVGALGTGALAWADLFLASGGVLNFGNGNTTVTHAAGSLAFSMAGTQRLLIDSSGLTTTGLVFLDTGCNISTGTTTGTKFGTATTQKMAFWNSTPVVQPTAVADASGGVVIDAEGRTALNALLARLRTIGIIAT